jgi:hypothetical protein
MRVKHFLAGALMLAATVTALGVPARADFFDYSEF